MQIGQRVLAKSPENKVQEYIVMAVNPESVTLVDENNTQIERYYWEIRKIPNEA